VLLSLVPEAGVSEYVEEMMGSDERLIIKRAELCRQYKGGVVCKQTRG
jgi:hypothetical protein